MKKTKIETYFDDTAREIAAIRHSRENWREKKAPFCLDYKVRKGFTALCDRWGCFAFYICYSGRVFGSNICSRIKNIYSKKIYMKYYFLWKVYMKYYFLL